MEKDDTQCNGHHILEPLPPNTLLKKRNERFRFRQLLLYLVLFSAAATLSATIHNLWSFLHSEQTSKVELKRTHYDPASVWQDNVWPLRPQTPWDISTDYPYPRRLNYDVREGTWLRLDVHPITGDIVFDMVGDIYCLPGAQALKMQPSDEPIKALPVLTGTPFDADPHFSPNGDRLVFKSDAGLGLENIWLMEWKGCEVMDIGSAEVNTELHVAIEQKDKEQRLLADGVPEDRQRKRNRLLREGRLYAQRVTNETYRWVSDARFHPSGSKVVATKWYTSRSSLGAGEGWEYPIPSVKDLRKPSNKIKAGSGTRLIGRSLPLGWTVKRYGDQQIGPEQFIWRGNDTIIYSKNIIDAERLSYSKDVHKGIYAIFQHNLTTVSTETLVDSFPGGASRPELSRDGRTLAFVRRVRDKEALVLKDLHTGSIHHIWHGLTYDLTSLLAPMGTYPSFSFSPDDSAVIIWAAGQIYSVPLAINIRGEKIASSLSPSPIRFTAHIEKQLAETRHAEFDVVGVEIKDTQKVLAFKDLRVDDAGKKAVFQAGGVTYWQDVSKKTTHKVPVKDDTAPYHSPSFIHGEDDLILHLRWSDTFFSKFELADIMSGKTYEFTGVPLGRYFSPAVCESHGSRRKIAYIKSGGSYLSGDIIATADPGLYIADIVLPDLTSWKPQDVKIRNIQFIPSEIDTTVRASMHFFDSNRRLLVQQPRRAFTIDLSGNFDQSGKPPHITFASGEMSTELAVSSVKKEHGMFQAKNIAFVEGFHVYLAPGSRAKAGKTLWSKPANATKGLVRLSLDGGHDVTWSRDGKTLFWFLGPHLHSLKISKLRKCASKIKHDKSTFGISCVKSLVKFQRITVEHPTDIARLKNQAMSAHKNISSVNSDIVIITNATILTMQSGNQETDLLRDGFMVIKGGVIYSVHSMSNFAGIADATIINANGGFIIPGFIDVHAHWDGFFDRYPAKSWEMETFLAYGITTLHNPSSANVDVFAERSRVERGQMVGPRIFTVGDIIYGGGIPEVHQEIVDMDEAVSALTRIKAEGGPGCISYKNYNLPSRASRQRLLKASKSLGMLSFPEGGMHYDWDLTYIIDGMTTVEHALPIPTLYEDVLSLYALSGTGSTPTHVVNYGGVWGEQIVWATYDVPNDPKLRSFIPHDILESLSESTSRPKNSFGLFNTSASVAAMVRKGLRAHIGAHGEPPLGLNYHAEMGFTGAGGLSNYEVLQAATSSAAQTLGIFSSLGSLSEGKLADFLVYPPGVDLLEGEISSNTQKLMFVARGGRIWDATTMVELWPMSGKKQTNPILNAE